MNQMAAHAKKRFGVNSLKIIDFFKADKTKFFSMKGEEYF